jgi:hypothetical protein
MSGRIFLPQLASPPRIVAVEGKFTIAELARWRATLLNAAEESRWIMLDLDEGRNRVTVGHDERSFASDSAELMSFAKAHAIPEEALHAIPMTRPESARGELVAAYATPATLGQYADTLVGGLRYAWWQSGGSSAYACTIGYPASFAAGGYGFVSAAHCSPSKWFTDGTSGLVGQPSTVAIGSELFDPSPGTCPFLWPCSTYRFSDANLNVVTGRPVRVGHLARPSTRSAVWPIGDTTLVNGATIPVVSHTSSIVQGSTMDRIGATTGWLHGPVKNTCSSYLMGSGTMVRCAYAMETLTLGGDSGGPVFYYDGSDAVATGIVFGSTFSGSSPRALFSKWMYIQSELSGSGSGAFNILNASAPVPPTPSVSIVGTYEKQSNHSCYWYVSSNFTYTDVQWFADGQPIGSNFDLWHASGTSFLLEVFVTGASASTSDSRWVSISGEAPECHVH